jgi:hypothetical protein
MDRLVNTFRVLHKSHLHVTHLEMLNSLKYSVYCTTCFNFQKLYILTTEFCYMFRIFLTMKLNYFLKQH